MAAAGAVLLALTAAGVRGSLLLVLVAAAGAAVSLAAVWWFLTRGGVRRWLAGAVLVLTPLTVAGLYAVAGLLWVVVLSGLLWAAALATARRALATSDAKPVEYEAAPPRHPYLIMNSRSGGGKVDRFRLADRARALGAQVHLLDGPAVDVAEVAREAVRGGADLLGVAGGDGTQALVAGVAAELGVPFLVVPAGTRNHFALDLGLDRRDPTSWLAALTDGVEVVVDLGSIGGRTFVNNVSFGAYAAVVRSPAYRADKLRTALDLLPGELPEEHGTRLRLRVDDTVVTGPQAVLVSNNPYALDEVAGLGRRPRLDGAVLGVLAITVQGTADAARLIGSRGRRGSLTLRTATKAVIDAEAGSVPVGIDGEPVTLPTPVHCVIRPAALRVRVPRHRPGVRPALPEMNWIRLWRLALPGRFTVR